jgi:hypothetical protein
VSIHPEPLIIAPSGSVCLNNSYSISATGAQTYSYSSGSSVVSPSLTTSYTVYGTSSLGCNSQAVTTITVLPLPNVTISPSNSVTICKDETLNLQAFGAFSYTWSVGSPGDSVLVLTPTTNTTYTVFGSTFSGCQNAATCYVSVDPCLTLEENQNEMDPVIFPNPAKDYFEIINITFSKLELINVLGQTLMTKTLKPGEKFYLQEVSAGTYVVKLFDSHGGTIFLRKLVKE